MIKIVTYTRKYYEADPQNRRCVNEDGNCTYTWGESHCAVGRYLKKEYQRENWEFNDDTSVNSLPYIDDYLKPAVQGLSENFWRRLQDFHDEHVNWVIYGNEYGNDDTVKDKYILTDRGKREFHGMIKSIKAGTYGNESDG
tara:strand:+ start:122 stop:544 length:423 start_codon:yes stop_codon:yes gene_type:complete